VQAEEQDLRQTETGVASGTVKWFNSEKGYGFIQPDAGGPDVFVHISAVERAGLRGLNDGQKISYEIQTGRNGKTAPSISSRSKSRAERRSCSELMC